MRAIIYIFIKLVEVALFMAGIVLLFGEPVHKISTLMFFGIKAFSLLVFWAAYEIDVFAENRLIKEKSSEVIKEA